MNQVFNNITNYSVNQLYINCLEYTLEFLEMFGLAWCPLKRLIVNFMVWKYVICKFLIFLKGITIWTFNVLIVRRSKKGLSIL